MKALCIISLLLIVTIAPAQSIGDRFVPEGSIPEGWERKPCGAILPWYASCAVLHGDPRRLHDAFTKALAQMGQPVPAGQSFDIDWDEKLFVAYTPENQGTFESDWQLDPDLDADTIHVFDSIFFKAVRDDGTVMPAVMVSEPQATLPLPAGKYFVTVYTKEPNLVEGYLHFVKSDSVLVGKTATLSGGATKQALIRVRKNPNLQPPNIFVAESGKGWMMYQNDDYYYAYVVENTVIRIYIGDHEFRIQPKAGEIWDLDVTMFQLSWDPGDMFSDPAVPDVPEVPNTPIRIQAENYSEWNGLRLSVPSVLAPPEAGIGGTQNGSWVKYAAVNLTGKKTITVRQSSVNDGRIMEIRTGSLTGPVIANYAGKNTGSWSAFEEVTIPIVPTEGTHDLYFIFRAHAVLDMDWFELR